MATTTPNYGFKKPAGSDFYDIGDQNGNWDIADGKIKEVSDAGATHGAKETASQNGAHGVRLYDGKWEVFNDTTHEWDEAELASGGSIVNVTTEDSEFFGQTVTLSDGTSSLTAAFDNEGKCQFKGVMLTGTLTASVTYEGDTYSNSVSVTYFGNYTIELSLGETFTLNITTTESTLYGKTITVTNGTKKKTGTFSDSGTATIKIHFTGNVTVTSTDGTDTATRQITVTSGTASYSVNLSFVQVYGASWDGTSTTAWSRTDESANFTDPVPAVSSGNGSSPFDSLMPWSGMTVSERTGGTMVAIPKFWYKLTQNGNGIKVQIADGEMDGFSVSPAHMDRGDGSGERDVVYVGRYHCGATAYKSATGQKPKANITRSTARADIHALGSKIWQMDFATRFTLWLLYIVEFADWNSQEKIGYGCGDNSATGNMGYTDSMTYHTGTTQSNRTTYGLGTQYRHIEGLWDNVYDWLDGCYYDANGLNIIKNPSNYSDSSGGTAVGIPSSGYPSKFVVSSAGGFPMFYPTEASGSETTYSCDSWGFGASSPCLFAGGSYSQVGLRGLFCVGCNGAASQVADRGCRLLELP